MALGLQEVFDIATSARIMALQEAAAVCAGYADAGISAESLAVELLGLARDAEPEGRDLELQWDTELARKIDGWAK